MARLASLLVTTLILACGCPGRRYVRQGPEPGVEQLVEHIRAARERARNLRAATRSDVRLGKERANVEVLIMVEWGGKLRYQAFYPNGSMAADLASDGERYCFIDVERNCGECGPATPENVGRLLTVVMPPDEVVAMMLGSTPVLPDATGTVTWDASSGREILHLGDAAGWKQRIVLDGRDRRWDVLESELRDPRGKLVWRIRHKDFRAVGATRLPEKSFFEQPGNDVLIRWREQEVGVEIPDRAWQLELPPGLPLCPA